MHIEELRDYCMIKKGVTEHFPFDTVTLVFKVMNKMFALTGLNSWEEGEQKINLKCDAQKALELRDAYEGINPGWHMNKRLWNTVTINTSDVPDDFVREMIDHSYQMVRYGLPKKVQNKLDSL